MKNGVTVMIRKRIYEITEKSEGHDKVSAVYDYAMILVIIASLVPLAFKADTPVLFYVDKVTVAIFILDYLLRWMTAEAMRYSKSFEIIGNVLRSSRESLIAVCALAGGYILVSALIIFNVEPDSFKNFFDAIYWATVSLTTVGYGDIYPVSTLGRVITMLSSVFGIAIVALPAGIITAGYMNEINKEHEEAGEPDAPADENE